MADEEPKSLPYVNEVVLKKRKNNEDWAIKRREQTELRKQRNTQNKKLVFRRAEEYIKEYRNKELDFIQMKHRKKQRKSSSKFDPESKLLFVIRIRGTNDMHLKTRKILHSLKLRSIYNGVFVKANEGVMEMLRMVEPYVTYGYPNLKSIKDLIYKKGYGNINKEKIPLTDNNVIEQELGKYNILCMEDIVNEIANAGPHFKEVVNFLWPFKLNRPEGGKLLKKKPIRDGGDAGDRKDEINELIKKMA